jgi:hypothetical protein
MTLSEALNSVQGMTTISMEDRFRLYDIIGAVNMGGYVEGMGQALKTFAPQIAEMVYAIESL